MITTQKQRPASSSRTTCFAVVTRYPTGCFGIDYPKPAVGVPRFVSGIRVRCIDDSGWIIPDPGFEHLSPEKGKIYTVREYAKMGGVGAISLMEGHEDNFYRACRFRPVSR